jgi:hypothetical protein
MFWSMWAKDALVPNPAARRKLTNMSTETHYQPKFRLGMRLRGHHAVNSLDCWLSHWPHLAVGVRPFCFGCIASTPARLVNGML